MPDLIQTHFAMLKEKKCNFELHKIDMIASTPQRAAEKLFDEFQSVVNMYACEGICRVAFDVVGSDCLKACIVETRCAAYMIYSIVKPANLK